MTYPYPQGTLSVVEATIRASTRLSQGRAGWGPAVSRDRAQFAALGDQEPMILAFHQFASTTLESLDATCFPRKAMIPGMRGMPQIMPPVFDVRTRRVYGRLFFLESDFDAAWWESMEPRTKPEAIAKWLRKEYGAHRPALLVEEILRAIKAGGVANIGKRTLEAAIALAWH